MDMIKNNLDFSNESFSDLFASLRDGWDYVRAHPVGVGMAAVGMYGLWYCYRPRNMPPGPWGYPLVGSLFSMGMEEHLTMMELAKKFGDVYTLWFGGNSYIVVLNSYDAAKEAFVTRGATYGNRKTEDGSVLGVKDDIFSSEYPEAKGARKRLNTALRKSGLADGRWNDTMGTELDELIEDLARGEGQPTDIEKLLQKSGVKHLCHILFGKRELSNDPGNRRFFEDISNWLNSVGAVFITQRIPYPVRYLLNYLANRYVHGKLRPVLDTVRAQVKDHVDTYDPDNIRDIVDLYLAAGELDRIGAEQLVINLTSLLPDGATATSAFTMWMLAYLLRYPEYQDKLYQEVKQVCHEDGHVHLEDKAVLPLMRGFVDEVLRLTSVVSVSIGQVALEDTTFRGFNIPKRTLLKANLYGINHDPERYPDPYRFMPERFTGTDGDKYETIAHAAFSFGRRSCAGEPLARSFIFFFVSNLVLNFHMELAPGEKLPKIEEYPWTLQRVPGPFNMVFKKREGT